MTRTFNCEHQLQNIPKVERQTHRNEGTLFEVPSFIFNGLTTKGRRINGKEAEKENNVDGRNEPRNEEEEHMCFISWYPGHAPHGICTSYCNYQSERGVKENRIQVYSTLVGFVPGSQQRTFLLFYVRPLSPCLLLLFFLPQCLKGWIW